LELTAHHARARLDPFGLGHARTEFFERDVRLPLDLGTEEISDLA
jgi:hypothetical protein